MFKQLGKALSGGNKKGKNKSTDATAAAGDNDDPTASLSSSLNSTSLNDPNGHPQQQQQQSIPHAFHNQQHPSVIDTHGTAGNGNNQVSKHQSPLPSPSISTGAATPILNGAGYGDQDSAYSPSHNRLSSSQPHRNTAASQQPLSSQQQQHPSSLQPGGGDHLQQQQQQQSSLPSPAATAIPAASSSTTTATTGAVRTFDIDDMIARLLEAGYAPKIPKPALKQAEMMAVCQAAREVFLSQPTLIELSPPVKIVGDTHGQYQDLLRLFDMCGYPPQANYLFLGDYVDRGKQSLETILLLLCYKIKYPENFFLLRGNHECANVTRVYGFYDECKRRVNIKIWKTFIDVFNTLPIAAVVASKIFCVHGGLSPSLSNMDDIRRIERPTDVPDYGLLNDLLWSDPSDTALDWEDNERGVSYCFGKAVIQQFLAQYDFDLICRAHMVVEDGYEFWNERTLVTIFSAPNYCGEFDNFGAVMSVSEDLLCAFELLKPLDGAALKKEMAKNKRKSMLQHQSPPAPRQIAGSSY
ncbi:hypothetical protein V8E36_005088 [Tilletia maclaganii]